MKKTKINFVYIWRYIYPAILHRINPVECKGVRCFEMQKKLMIVKQENNRRSEIIYKIFKNLLNQKFFKFYFI